MNVLAGCGGKQDLVRGDVHLEELGLVGVRGLGLGLGLGVGVGLGSLGLAGGA